ncbi:hypothetical protein HYFRA_00014100 [Hymenoscyphus fraxineus]|uniref:Polyketide synthase n=1 Tax=Hymenoscyphus fraxineus TaxID=746836 RepID=A0A9N9LCJ2_9HELO|nr:hypothetical protein HYFRA_00014100 [Hymenoscyphus fraxineus]
MIDGHTEIRVNETNNTNDNFDGHAINGESGITNGNVIMDVEGSIETNEKLRDIGVEPIAIVGMATRLPGGVHSPESFWDLLVNKKNARCDVPKDRWNSEAYYNKHRKHDTMVANSGYFLEELDLGDFDAAFFNLSKAELVRLDPQQRLLLEVTWECLESAGQTNWRGKNIGCYVGTFGEDWHDIQQKDPQDTGIYRLTGHGDYVIPNRVSYEFDFKGPSMAFKTACSSSLIAIHTACAAIRNGDCESAVVGGTNLIIGPGMSISMTEQGVISPSGQSRSFDASADGYARGEAINAIYIKKLSDAIRDGDPIRSIIRGSATNSDGKTTGISYPNTEAHEAVIRKAYQQAGIEDFSQTAMVECHGTGSASTPVGDPLEANAVARVFGKDGVIIGSVKPNVGHGEGASGLTSTIKMVLALEKNTIPPNMLFNTPNPKIPWESAKLSVAKDASPWPASALQRVSVNSFGIAGANAHIIMDSAASFGVGRSASSKATTSRPELLVFSANHMESLKKSTENYQRFVETSDVALGDLAYTLNSRRNHLLYRTFAVTDGKDTMEFPAPTKSGAPPILIWVFTGQGAQWAGMGRELFENYPSFCDDIREMDAVLASCPHPPSWTIEAELLKPQESSSLDKAEFSQPLCTAIQIGIVNFMRSWKVAPRCVVGHSSGEIAAAYSVNAITAKEAILIAYYRGQVTKSKTQPGGMAAVGLGREVVAPYLTTGVVIACENSPESVTISGDSDKLQEVMAALKEAKPEAFVRLLRVEKAYHSHHMKAYGEEYQALLQDKIASRQPTIPMMSSVTGKPITQVGKLDAEYWRSNLESPVLFHTAVNNILNPSMQRSVFLEIGPHAALAGPLRQIFKTSSVNPNYVPTLQRNANATKSLLSAIGHLHCHCYEVDFLGTNPSRNVLTNLPSYAWHYEGKYWKESRISKAYRMKEFPHHDTLGSRVAMANEFTPTWRNIISLDNVPWIEDHKLHTDIVFPGAGYIATVGEAIRQLTGLEDYTVRNVTISAAMVFPESRELEMMTYLSPSRVTVSLDSVWHDFTISSYSGTSWTKHCIGQVRGGSETEVATHAEIPDLPRKVPSPRWYQTMSNVGLNYSGSFVGLKQISAAVDGNIAAASVIDECKVTESHYALHPATIDLCIQLFSVALAKGQTRVFDHLCIPTYIEELYIRPSTKEMRLQAQTTSKQNVITGNAHGIVDGETILELKGLRLSPVEGEANPDADPHAGVELVWKPDIDFLDDKNLIKVSKSIRDVHVLIEKLAVLCILETSAQLTGANCRPEDECFIKFATWVEEQKLRILSGDYPLVPDIAELSTIDEGARMIMIRSIYEETQKTDGAAVGEALLRTLENFEKILSGTVDTKDLLLEEDIFTRAYGFAGNFDHKEFFALLTHKKPHLNILEIGAGTGIATETILRNLESEYGERLYRKYTYTDTSADSFGTAKNKFQSYAGIDYAVLDISKDPIEQGFEANAYDLIIASNAIHTTPSIGESLTNIHKLLNPHGRLFMQELCPETKWINYIMGLSASWWLNETKNRIGEPFISSKQWDEELRKAGFSGAETVVHNDEKPYQIIANIIARPVVTASITKKVTLLYVDAIGSELRELESALISNGYEVTICQFPQAPPPGQDIISLIDLERPFFTDISSDRFSQFLEFTALVESLQVGVLWVTKASQMHCVDPSYAPVIGMARTIRSEVGTAFATLEIDSVDSKTWKPLCQVYEKFQRRTKDEEVDCDSEFALSEGIIYTSRFHWLSVSKELAQTAVSEIPKILEIEKKGQLSTLHWLHVPNRELAPDEVQVECRAVGMNFKDVLIAMGIVEGQLADSSGLGCECAGVISKVGSACKTLTPGDRVMLFTPGALATSLVLREELCAKIPDSLSFEDAATIPCVYGTVIHSLVNLGRLEKGQSVLIHSATGGVGISAIHICKYFGAVIYVSVGTEEKAKYLMDTFDIPRTHIFNSRDSSFITGVMRETNGRGVDLVLNSLSGDLLHTSWKCVAAYGKMLEIGKRDFIGRGKLTMDLFEANRSFFGIDTQKLCVEKPEMIGKLLEQGLDLYEKGGLKPLRPITYFDATQVEEAFRFMQRGEHMGKIVVKMPIDKSILPAVPMPKDLILRPDASYLLVGGLGGLGQAVSTWMVENGAKNLIYLSRSAGKTERDQLFIKELEAYGCSVQTFAGSVSELSDVKNVVKNATMPIAGVMQMSMVLRDGAFSQMSFEDWQTVTSPKVQGTWNLHQALGSLDFLILFSSISGLVGQIGQANYAAANTFLDAFVQYRHTLHLPASVLDIGAVFDVGYVSENKMVLETFLSSGVYGLKEKHLLDSLHLMITRSSPSKTTQPSFCNHSQVGIGFRSTKSITDPQNRNIWKRDPRMSIYRNLETISDVAVTSSSSALTQFLSNARMTPSILDQRESMVFLAREIGLRLFGFLMRSEDELDISMSLTAVGLDSLVAIEMRNWWRQNLGFDVTVLEILAADSIEQLGELAAGRLKAKYDPSDV